MRQGLVILLIIVFLGSLGACQPALAASGDTTFNLFMGPMSAIALCATAYFVYKNSPAERARGYPENLGPGEWYLAGYSGVSYLPPTDWKFTNNNSQKALTGPIAENISYQPGVLGGIKFGRYLDSIPWFGIESEMSVSRNNIRGNQGRISPPPPDLPTDLLKGSDSFIIWAIQTNFLARYGFFKDKEVSFGRLQPYIGIGPGFEVVYGRYDAAKNFAIEALAGVRYMFTEKIGLFFEYKYSYQFSIEYEDVPSNNKSGKDYTFTFDLPHHRFVLGVSYHFKNLFGN